MQVQSLDVLCNKQDDILTGILLLLLNAATSFNSSSVTLVGTPNCANETTN